MEQHDTSDPAPAPTRVVRSAATAIVIAWSMRFIGLFSVLVLARLLTPADFGIVALAAAFLSLAEIFTSLGLRQSLLRVTEPERSHYDTVWTLQLLVLSAMALVVAALAPVVAWFYEEPALVAVTIVLAARFIIIGFANIGITDFDRNLEFGRDLKMRLSVRLTSFAITVAAAVVLQSYWALVIGSVAFAICHCAASYIAHPYRPRFSFARRKEMLGMSLWMFLANAAQTIHTEMERFFVGRLGTMSVTGLYSVSKDLSSIFTQEVATALNRVTFVTTAKTGERLGADPLRVEMMLGAYALIAAPLGLGLAATAPNAVAVLLGDQWSAAPPFLKLIAPAAAIFAVHKLIISSLQASGGARLAAFLAMGGVGLVASAISAVVAMGGGPLDMAKAVLGACAVMLAAGIGVLGIVERINWAGLTLAILRPFAAACLMGWAVASVPDGGMGALPALIVEVAIGAVVYGAAILSIWALSGRPQGAEAQALTMLEQFWQSRRTQGEGAK